MMRCNESSDWKKIGITCSAGRRSLWFKVDNPTDPINSNVIELCSGREGDDAYVKISRENFSQFHELLDVILTAEYASET